MHVRKEAAAAAAAAPPTAARGGGGESRGRGRGIVASVSAPAAGDEIQLGPGLVRERISSNDAAKIVGGGGGKHGGLPTVGAVG
jgi:hypothetical protein